MSTTKYDHLPEQEKHAALAREEAAIKAEALRYHDKHRMTPAKAAKLTARHVVLALLAAFWLIPILWLVVTSFGVDKGPNISTFFPKAYTLDHYKALLSPDSVNQFPQWMLNTFIVACFTCVISTLFVLMVAYAMSCMRFKARKPLMNIAIILNLFPGFLSMIAVYFIMKQFGLTGTLTGLIIVYSAGSGMGYLIAKGFFDTVSKSLRESAYLEGANEFTVFWKIILPLSKPIIVYTVINSFLAPWMDFVFADLMMTSGTAANKTVALGLFAMVNKVNRNNYFAQFCAGGVIVSIPISILFVIMQKFFRFYRNIRSLWLFHCFTSFFIFNLNHRDLCSTFFIPLFFQHYSLNFYIIPGKTFPDFHRQIGFSLCHPAITPIVHSFTIIPHIFLIMY